MHQPRGNSSQTKEHSKGTAPCQPITRGRFLVYARNEGSNINKHRRSITEGGGAASVPTEGDPVDPTVIQTARICGADLEGSLPLAPDWVLTNYLTVRITICSNG